MLKPLMIRWISSLFLLISICGILFGPFGIYIFGVSVNFILFALLFASGVLYACAFGQERHLWATLVGSIVFLVIFVVLVPSIYGKFGTYSISDAQSLLWFLLFWPFILIVREGQFQKVLDTTLISVRLVAGLITFVWVNANFLSQPEFAYGLRLSLGSFSQSAGASTDHIFIGPIHDGSFRIQWIVSVCFPVFMYVSVKVKSKLALFDLVLFALATFASGSRALILSFLVLLIFLGLERFKGVIIKTLFLGSSIVGLVSVYLFIAIDSELRVFDIWSDLGSNSARYLQFSALIEAFFDNPLFGHGFGYFSPDFVTNQYAPYSYELVLLALLTKLGVFGSLVLVALFLGLTFKVVIRKSLWPLVVLCFFIGFMTTNPYLFSLVGVICLCSLYASFLNDRGRLA